MAIITLPITNPVGAITAEVITAVLVAVVITAADSVAAAIIKT